MMMTAQTLRSVSSNKYWHPSLPAGTFICSQVTGGAVTLITVVVVVVVVVVVEVVVVVAMALTQSILELELRFFCGSR